MENSEINATLANFHDGNIISVHLGKDIEVVLGMDQLEVKITLIGVALFVCSPLLRGNIIYDILVSDGLSDIMSSDVPPDLIDHVKMFYGDKLKGVRAFRLTSSYGASIFAQCDDIVVE